MVESTLVKKRRLGRTGLEVSEIGFGTWGIGGKIWTGSEDALSLAALERAVQLGINFVDTALAYGSGHSERLIRRLLEGGRSSVIVSTKVPPRERPLPGVPVKKTYPPRHVLKCTKLSARNLGLDRLDLQQFHFWNEEWASQKEWQEAVYKLKRKGKARFIGISVNDHQPASVIPALRTGLIDCIQVIYNIFDQSPADELFQICRNLDIGVIARCPFDEGSLTGRITPETTFPPEDWRSQYFSGNRKSEIWQRVQRLQCDLGGGEPLAVTALRFCLSNPAVSTVIPGMRTPQHVEENVAASSSGPLPADTLQILYKHRWMRNFYVA